MELPQDYKFGKHERLDAEVLKSKEGCMDLSSGGDVVKQEYTHEIVGQEMLALFNMTKMSTHERAIMACRFSGLPIWDALVECQRHGLCFGMKVWEAQAIENDIKNRMLRSLQKQGIVEVQEKEQRGDAPSTGIII